MGKIYIYICIYWKELENSYECLFSVGGKLAPNSKKEGSNINSKYQYFSWWEKWVTWRPPMGRFHFGRGCKDLIWSYAWLRLSMYIRTCKTFTRGSAYTIVSNSSPLNSSSFHCLAHSLIQPKPRTGCPPANFPSSYELPNPSSYQSFSSVLLIWLPYYFSSLNCFF